MFICAAWKKVVEGPLESRRTLVYRCDLDEGHGGSHVDNVLAMSWPDSDSAPECHPRNEFKPDWVAEAKRVVIDCAFQCYTFTVKTSETTGAVYLQGHYLEADTLTGKVETQYTRRWFLSPAMGKSEIVATAFKCALTSMEHRTREWFLYKGRAVYQPHYDVDALWAICQEREVRTPAEVQQ
jgi:hypothetical protein